MKIPSTPFIYFRFAAKPAGEMMIHTGSGRGSRADMARKVKDVDQFAAQVFWPRGNTTHTADRLTSNFLPARPKRGGMVLSYDGERYVLWTGVNDSEITEISRYASGLLAESVRPADLGGA